MITLNMEQYRTLKEGAQYSDCSTTATYSGRGMYGESCLGISGDYVDIWSAYLLLKECLGETLAEEIMDSRREDSLGYGTIVYFTQVKVELDEDYNDHDD